MMIFFVIFIAALAVVLQQLAGKRALDSLEESHRTSADIVEPDERFDIIITFSNHSKMFLPYIKYRERMNEGFNTYVKASNSFVDGRGDIYVTGTTWLKPHQTLEKHIPVSIDRRGRYLLRELTVYGGDFLGINEQVRSYKRMNEVIVYPREAPSGKIDKVFGGFLGDISVSRFIFEDPVLTLGYREYTGREPMKMISWTQSARSNGLMVKKYDYTLEPSVSVALNIATDIPGSEEDIEKCFSIARTVCHKLEDQGIKYDFRMNSVMIGAMTFRCYVTEGLGKRHFYTILESLGRASYTVTCPSEEIVDLAVRNTGSSHGIIFITPGGEPQVEARARQMAESAGVTMLVLTAKEVLS